MLGYLRNNYDRILFALGILILVFGAGMFVAVKRIFPYHYVNEAFDAAEDWRRLWRHYLGIRSKWLYETARTDGVSVHDPARTWPGVTFVSGYRDGGWHAWLMDMDGKELHRWSLPSDEIWASLDGKTEPVPEIDTSIHGAHLYDDGAILAVVGGRTIVKLDACSKLQWSSPILAHHSVDVQPNGDILVPGMVRETKRMPSRPNLVPGREGYYDDQLIVRLAPDGRTLEQHSVLDLLYGSGWESLLYVGHGINFTMADVDPLHLNDIEVLQPEMAAAFPMFEAGDLMIDIRNLNTLAVVDGDDFKIKWAMTGPFYGQHDPDFLPNGHILMYDNRMSPALREHGSSRVIEIDPATKTVVWSFDGGEKDRFYSSIGGKVQQLPNGNVLAVAAVAGRVIEIARDDPAAIVWSYTNVPQEGWAGAVYDAMRLPEVTGGWVGKTC
ncbi:MAG: arylsulfotransferase family protein [Geminicoccaceae bacterium]